MPDDIRQPYASSWTVGIQRDLGGRRAIEVRYNGNRTRNQWLAHNINEVNIFENGFLDEFKNAQRNLAINQAAGVTVLRQPRPAGAGGPPHLHRDGHRVQQRERRQQPAERRGRHLGQHVGDQPRLRLFDVWLGNPGVRRQRRPGQGLSPQLLEGEPIRHWRGHVDGRQRLLQLPRPAGGVPSAQLARHVPERELHLEQDHGRAPRRETLRPAIPSSRTATSCPATRLPSPTGGMSST